ncbi:peptide-methionine (S)-S-oxide reductase MsrA [Mycoplasma sp. 327]
MKKTIYLAGGCFWGVQAYFSRLKGVIETKTGYANGNTDVTSYYQIKSTLHAETVRVIYDDEKISLEELVLHLFRIINPGSLNKQGGDIGIQYRTGVYYDNESDFTKLEKLFNILKGNYSEFYVELLPLKNFVIAEEYHQNYLQRNPSGYCHVRLDIEPELNESEKKIINLLK